MLFWCELYDLRVIPPPPINLHQRSGKLVKYLGYILASTDALGRRTRSTNPPRIECKDMVRPFILCYHL